MVQAIIDAGYRDHLILSADVNSFSLGWRTPAHTVGHLLRYFVPLMRSAGIDDDTINHLFVENPRRVLPIQ
jgi:phosphotriesterase-related protein